MARTETKPEPNKRTERLDLRVPAATKAMIRHAAEIKGMSSSDFVISAAYDAAQATLLGHEIMKLDREQSLRLIEALRDPPEPNEALRALMRSSDA